MIKIILILDTQDVNAPSFNPKGKEDKFNKYYIEIEENNNNRSDILHFFFGNDSEKSEFIKYNEETIKYIQEK